MNTDQRRTYFRLWAAACQRQDWNPKDDALRRDATREATGQESTKRLTQLEITRLFDWLKLQADPDNLDRAIAVAASPDEAAEENQRRQLIHSIERMGFADTYITQPAKALCMAAGAAEWRRLPTAALEKLRYTLTTRARQRDAKARGKSFTPRAEPYHLRRSTKVKRAAARAPQVVPRPEVAAHLAEDDCPF